MMRVIKSDPRHFTAPRVHFASAGLELAGLRLSSQFVMERNPSISSGKHDLFMWDSSKPLLGE